jgi:AcrR family transcriptional regulator
VTVSLRRRPGRPKQQAGETPTANSILTHAANLFMDLGYEGVSVEMVARECNLTKASIYYHFANKSSLFTASIVQLMALIEERTEDLLRREQSLYERLYNITLARLRVEQTRLEFTTLMHEAKPMLSKAQIRRMQEAEERLAKRLADAIERANADGEVCADNAYLAAHTFLHLLSLGNLKDGEGHNYFSAVEDAARYVVDCTWAVLTAKKPAPRSTEGRGEQGTLLS